MVDGRSDLQPAVEPDDVGASCSDPEQQLGMVATDSLPDAADEVDMPLVFVAVENRQAVESMTGKNVGLLGKFACEVV